jgi:hypothetical protein
MAKPTDAASDDLFSRWLLVDGQAGASAEPMERSIEAEGGCFYFAWETLGDGKRRGVQQLRVGHGDWEATILATRGMSLWRCRSGTTPLGWTSPVKGPVHPQWVPVHDPSGLGWLEGFDELVVRCGLESNGAPEHDSGGRLLYPLHGRIGNLPAHHLEILVDRQKGVLEVLGEVDEVRFLIQGLRLEVRYRFEIGRKGIGCVDRVVNLKSTPATMQLLYHINLGSPLLGEGSTLHAAFDRLVPRNARAAEGLPDWNRYAGPTAGFAEQVYLMKARADDRGWSTAMLVDPKGEKGVAVGFQTRTLPFLNLWKNTGALEDGYVTGIEPATGFPNPRGFEQQQGRLVVLEPGEARDFQWSLDLIEGSPRVEELRRQISSATTSPSVVESSIDRCWASL